MTDYMKELNEKFKSRKLLEELAYFANYPPKGYIRKAETYLLQWVLYHAYKVIKEGCDEDIRKFINEELVVIKGD